MEKGVREQIEEANLKPHKPMTEEDLIAFLNLHWTDPYKYCLNQKAREEVDKALTEKFKEELNNLKQQL